MSAIPDEVLSLLPAGVQQQIKSVLWHGAKPCYQCGGTLHSKYEQNAGAYVCAGCYNEFAIDMGWETRRYSTQEKATKYDALIKELRRLKAVSIIGQEVDLCTDLIKEFA
jgi:hypothetical protein